MSAAPKLRLVTTPPPARRPRSPRATAHRIDQALKTIIDALGETPLMPHDERAEKILLRLIKTGWGPTR